VAWLCSDEAAEITGRQFVISGNRVTLLYPAAHLIADKEPEAEAWSADEIGQQIKASVAEWPEPAGVPGLLF
jgi:hypothetical protein